MKFSLAIYLLTNANWFLQKPIKYEGKIILAMKQHFI